MLPPSPWANVFLDFQPVDDALRLFREFIWCRADAAQWLAPLLGKKVFAYKTDELLHLPILHDLIYELGLVTLVTRRDDRSRTENKNNEEDGVVSMTPTNSSGIVSAVMTSWQSLLSSSSSSSCSPCSSTLAGGYPLEPSYVGRVLCGDTGSRTSRPPLADEMMNGLVDTCNGTFGASRVLVGSGKLCTCGSA